MSEDTRDHEPDSLGVCPGGVPVAGRSAWGRPKVGVLGKTVSAAHASGALIWWRCCHLLARRRSSRARAREDLVLGRLL